MYPEFEGEVARTCEVYEAPVEVVTLTYNWEIKQHHNFTLLQAQTSQNFSDAYTPEWIFSLQCPSNTSKFILFYLEMKCSPDIQVRGKFTISLLSSEGRKLEKKKYPLCNLEPDVLMVFEEFARSDLVFDLLKHESLSVLCKVKYMINKFNFPAERNVQKSKNAKNELCDNFKALLECETLCDVTIHVDNVEFGAHKSVLAARSQVFAAMFEHEMEEKKSNRVYLNEIKPEVFKQLLYFIYTGNVPNLEENVSDLLAAADFYALEQLKGMSVEILRESLCIENAVETLLVADMHKIASLKAQAIDFINKNTRRVIQTQGWKEFKDSRSPLIVELYEESTTQ